MIVLSDESADVATPSGPMRTAIFRPVAAGRYPGILMYSEIFQITGPIRRTASLLASHGFVVAVPEIYHELEPAGTILPYDSSGADRGNQDKTTKELAGYDMDARAALDFLKTHPACTGKLGTFGICIGGHLAFRAAFQPDVLAAACFYATDIHKRGLGRGMNDDTLDRLKELRGEMLMIWGRQDPHVSREGRQLIYNALSDAEVLVPVARVQRRPRLFARRRPALRPRPSRKSATAWRWDYSSAGLAKAIRLPLLRTRRLYIKKSLVQAEW